MFIINKFNHSPGVDESHWQEVEGTCEDYVAQKLARLSSDNSGTIENIEKQIENNASFLARLTQKLHDKGIFSEDEIKEML